MSNGGLESRSPHLWPRALSLSNSVSVARKSKGDWMKEGEGISQRNIYMSHGHRQQCGDGQKEGSGLGAGERRGKEMRTCIKVSTIKIKF